MPSGTAPPPEDAPHPGAGPAARRVREVRAARPAARVVVEPGGPLLVEGPVEVVLPDGTTARSDRFRVAVCCCRRSRRYPWCDTSHRRRRRAPHTGDAREETSGG